MVQSVSLNGVDISKFVTAIDPIPQDSGQYGALTINTIGQIEGINYTGFWDSQVPVSPFYGLPNYDGIIIYIYFDSALVFTGSIISIDILESENANIHLRSNTQKILEGGAIYVSNQTETPAQAVMNICNYYKIKIDSLSFGQADLLYSTNLISITVSAIKPDLSLLDLLHEISKVGIAKLFTIGDTLFMQAYGTLASDSALSIYPLHYLLSQPSAETIEKQKLDGYSVKWRNGEAQLVPTSSQIQQMNNGAEGPVTIETLQTAVWVGNSWINFSRQLQFLYEFKIPATIGKSCLLGMPLALQYGTRDIVIVDITYLDKSDPLTHSVKAESR